MCTRLEDELGRVVAHAQSADLRFRLTYFELVALRDASCFLFPAFWFENDELSPLQREHRDSLTADYRVPPWNPELDGFVPFNIRRDDPAHRDGESTAPALADELKVGASKGVSVEAPQIPQRKAALVPLSVGVSGAVPDSPRRAVSGTVTQERIIEADALESLLVLAPPGTGKTHVLVERLVHLLTGGTFEAPSRQLLVLSFTRATVAEVRRRLGERMQEQAPDDLRYVSVTTFDSFTTRVLVESGNEKLLYAGAGDSYDSRIRSLVEILEAQGGRNKVPESLSTLRYLVVDEIQDLVGFRARLVLALIRIVHANGGAVLLLGDPAQAIYDYTNQTPNSREFLNALRQSLTGRGHEVALAKFFRFADSGMEQLVADLWEAVGRDGSNPDGEALRHLLYGLGSPRDFSELPALAASQKSVALLVRNNAQAIYISEWLKENGVPVSLNPASEARRWPAGLAWLFMGWKQDVMSRATLDRKLEALEDSAGLEEAQRTRHALEHSGVLGDAGVNLRRLRTVVATEPPPHAAGKRGGIVVSTVHRSKGLEYDTVLFLEPGRAESSEELRIMYVAATRARRKLGLLKANPKIVRKAWPVHGTRYFTSYDRVLLAGSNPIDPAVCSALLERTLPVAESQRWFCNRLVGASAPTLSLFVRCSQQQGRVVFTIGAFDAGRWQDLCLLGGELGGVLFKRRHYLQEIGAGLQGWPVEIEALETVAMPVDDAAATDALGTAGLAWLPLLGGWLSTKGGVAI